ncbi:membrane-bound PQQ-dependent dehydrogenase, glucose/quinate/shikimate family [Corticibacter populi]|uniref:Membrane-bound PQQ-dependent dehydrogenase, glucose/quinate/shikimate family n=1 Tax=Corticibacter populi TaxID=1550736 RepID=A0A3M6QV20_9BURK|nr:membrane-bound PQQ-dependent dehydrogenase, glucose/quinate/shikimate family [Corticibacter populi]RMX06874.1 membrane-bound PQQ-dependent dehydrogenase, glucose/quinate/shikimate family [Corticibacter populi]RZS31532.1 quinate dehydrogenase (quinone) [Corticibacter populi]
MATVSKRSPLLMRIVGGLLALLGLVLAAGGAWLIALGGSWFYLFAGLAMAGVGVGLVRARAWALWLALALLLASAIWAFSEVGTDFWQWVPRSIAFLVVALVAAIAAPRLYRDGDVGDRPALGRKPAGALALVLLAGIVGIFAGMFRPHPTVVAKPDASAPVVHPDAGQDSGNDWPAWGRNTGGNRYVQFDQINKANVKDLQVAWTYRTGDLAVDGAEYQVTPLKIDDTLYLCTPLNKVIAVDAVSGQEKWRYDPQPKITASTRGWKRCRGVGYADLDQLRPSPDGHTTEANTAMPATCRKRIVSTTIDARLFTLDAQTGKLCEDFGNQGFVDLTVGLSPTPATSDEGTYNVTSAPLVADGVVMVGGRLNDNLTVGEPSGVVRGFDVSTGELLWAWDAARGASDSSPLPAGETYAPETPNFWGTAAYDPELGLAYFPTGNQTPDFWTGNRHPYSDEYNDSIVAVELKTGKERWHFRTANIDQFDYDVSSQPILHDLKKADGSVVPVVIQLTKRGQVFVLDRRDGTPVVPVEYRKVSTDAMPGMQVADTQPHSAISVGTEPFKESDMWGASIFDQLYCRIQFKQMRWEGEFTPLSDKQRTLIYPGYYGGMNWGGGALDAATGTLIVNDIRMAQWGRFIKQDEALRIGLKPSTEGEYSTQTGTPWGVERSMFISPLGVPCFKPPFGTLSAIDLASGETKWQVPMGTIQDAPVHGIVPGVRIPLGMPTMGGPLVTGGGLTFFHGTLDYYVRAMDNDTGEELWRGRLPVGGQGAPMSYVGADGKQYVVVVAGGATRTGTNDNRGDYVIAYRLP